MNRNRHLCFFFALAAAPLLFLSGCRKSSNSAAAPSQASTAGSPASTERHHRMFMGGVSPLIVSMSPETVQFSNGHVPVAHYSLTYEIDHPEKVTKAYISIYAPGVGEVQQFDVDNQPRGQIEFTLNASDFDLGPTVRFRVHCPYGDTDWYIMGSDSMSPLLINSSRQIGNVNPGYVAARPGGSYGVPITIVSGLIMKTCTAEAQVDYSSVELQNVVAGDKRINAVLPADALQGRPVTVRHLEVKLVVNGQGMPAADVYNLNFVE
jgi:hypothetical protein